MGAGGETGVEAGRRKRRTVEERRGRAGDSPACLDEVDPALVGGGGEAAHVADDAAAEGHERRPAVEALLERGGEDLWRRRRRGEGASVRGCVRRPVVRWLRGQHGAGARRGPAECGGINDPRRSVASTAPPRALSRTSSVLNSSPSGRTTVSTRILPPSESAATALAGDGRGRFGGRGRSG